MVNAVADPKGANLWTDPTTYYYIPAQKSAAVPQKPQLVTTPDKYAGAITVAGGTEEDAYPAYAAHQEVSLLARRTADTPGCTP
ncbi:hypothetical protein [Kaarinaea lacus]